MCLDHTITLFLIIFFCSFEFYIVDMGTMEQRPKAAGIIRFHNNIIVSQTKYIIFIYYQVYQRFFGKYASEFPSLHSPIIV